MLFGVGSRGWENIESHGIAYREPSVTVANVRQVATMDRARGI